MPGPADLTSQEQYFPYYHFIPVSQTIGIYNDMIGRMQADFAAAMQALRTQLVIEQTRAIGQQAALAMNPTVANLRPPPTTLVDLALRLAVARVLVSELRDFVARPAASPMNPESTLAELKSSLAWRIGTLASEISRQRSGPLPAGGAAAIQSGVAPPPSNSSAAAKLSHLKNRF